MDFDITGEVIATRRLYFVDENNEKKAASVLLGKPEEARVTSGYHCAFQVIGIGSQATQIALGRDSIEALQSALILIAATLNQLNDEIGETLIWEDAGKRDPGFP